MKTCPSGHQTAALDFCEVCGMEIESPSAPTVIQKQEAPPVSLSKAPVASVPTFVHPRSTLDKVCPICTTPRTGVFCELCGYNFSTCQAPVERETIFPPKPTIAEPLPTVENESAEPPPKPGTWSISLEPQSPGGLLTSRTLPFHPSEMVIGRSSKRNPQKPDIDLHGDDSVSHRHAVLRLVEGGVTLTDLGSANGTLLNQKPIQSHQAVPLQPGDRITVGVQWFLLLKTLS